jgi:glycosyltransferase involved in cell wall biosynthesis
MKIAYFTESLPPLTDGVSHTLSYLKKTLTAENCDFLFFSPFRPDSDGWRDRVVKITSLPFPLYARYKFSLPAFHDLKPILDAFRPEIIHVCSPFFLGMAAYNYGHANQIPVVNSYHTRFVSYLKYYGLGWFESHGWRYLRWFYNQAARNFVPSRATISELESEGFRNLVLWERGIDTARFSYVWADKNLRDRWSPEGKPIALYVGRLVKEKDIHVLIKAYQILKDRKAAIKLVIVGDGPLKGEIARVIPDAILAGFLSGDELSRAYASADIFVFPSTTESFGNVVLEAAASGLPAVVAAEGGVMDTIRDGETGFLSRPGDPIDFAAKVESLLNDTVLRHSMSSKALEYALTKSWRQVNLRLLQSYEEIIESSKVHSAEHLHRPISEFNPESVASG